MVMKQNTQAIHTLKSSIFDPIVQLCLLATVYSHSELSHFSGISTREKFTKVFSTLTELCLLILSVNLINSGHINIRRILGPAFLYACIH